jgi:GT2 family glycosyltransferase
MRVLVIIPVAPDGVQLPDRKDTTQAAVDSAVAQVGVSEYEVGIATPVGYGGPSNGRNTAARASDADVLAFLDNDDWWGHNYLQRALLVLSTSGADVVVSERFGSSGRRWGDTDFKTALSRGVSVTSGSGLIVTRQAFEAVGGFDETICGDDVFDFCVRLAAASKVFALQSEETWHRELGRSDHAGNVRDIYTVQSARMQIARKYLGVV